MTPRAAADRCIRDLLALRRDASLVSASAVALGHSVCVPSPGARLGVASGLAAARRSVLVLVEEAVVIPERQEGITIVSGSEAVADAALGAGWTVWEPAWGEEALLIIEHAVSTRRPGVVSVHDVTSAADAPSPPSARSGEGEFRVLVEGMLGTVIASGAQVPLAVGAAELLAQRGLQIGVVQWTAFSRVSGLVPRDLRARMLVWAGKADPGQVDAATARVVPAGGSEAVRSVAEALLAAIPASK